MLAAGYDFLRSTMPFRRWRLPPSSEVKFYVRKHAKWRAQYTYDHSKKSHMIEVSDHYAGHTNDILATVAHEMAHLRLIPVYRNSQHGPKFQRLKDLVCKHHGFNPSTF